MYAYRYGYHHHHLSSHRISPRLDDAQDLVLIYSSSCRAGVVVHTGAQDVGRVEVPEAQVSVTART